MAFTGKIYWQSGDIFMQCYDTDSGELHALMAADYRIPAVMRGTSKYGNDVGAMFPLGNGNILVQSRQIGPTQSAFVVNPTLEPTGQVWQIPCNTHYYNAGYVGYEDASGVYDPKTGLNWMAYTVEGQAPWEWNAYDNDGNWVEGRGDCSTIIPWGDAYLGGNQNWGINASMLDRWLYREGPFGDCFLRYNLDTDEWQAILPPPPPDQYQGYQAIFVGTDRVNGTIITVDTGNSPENNAADGLIQVRDPNADPWVNPVPDGISSPDFHLGEPLAVYSLYGPGGPTPEVGQPGYNYVSGSFAISKGHLYFQSNPDYANATLDADGWPSGTGPFFSFYRLNLADGGIEKVADIPYAMYNTQSQPCSNDDPDFFVDNWTQGLCGAFIVEESAIAGKPIGSRRAFKGT